MGDSTAPLLAVCRRVEGRFDVAASANSVRRVEPGPDHRRYRHFPVAGRMKSSRPVSAGRALFTAPSRYLHGAVEPSKESGRLPPSILDTGRSLASKDGELVKDLSDSRWAIGAPPLIRTWETPRREPGTSMSALPSPVRLGAADAVPGSLQPGSWDRRSRQLGVRCSIAGGSGLSGLRRDGPQPVDSVVVDVVMRSAR